MSQLNLPVCTYTNRTVNIPITRLYAAICKYCCNEDTQITHYCSGTDGAAFPQMRTSHLHTSRLLRLSWMIRRERRDLGVYGGGGARGLGKARTPVGWRIFVKFRCSAVVHWLKQFHVRRFWDFPRERKITLTPANELTLLAETKE